MTNDVAIFSVATASYSSTKGVHRYIHMVASDDVGFFMLVQSDASLARCHALEYSY